MRRQKATVLGGTVMALIIGGVSTAVGQKESSPKDHPETLGEFYPGHGHEWTAASVALNPDGSVHERALPGLREDLEYQAERSLQDHGLAEGEMPPKSHPFCAPVRKVIEPVRQETNRFDATMLLSEVAVVATVSDIVPGFRLSGNPELLVVLSDVRALRDGSPLPRYLLIPVEGRVIHGKVFCAVNPTGWSSEIEGRSIVGEQLVVMGAWNDGAFVRAGLNHTAAVAYVRADETLRWTWAGWHDGPGDLVELDERFDEARSAGLFDLTRELLLEPWGSARRLKFGTTLGELSGHSSDCHLRGYEIDDGDLRFISSCHARERPKP